MNIITQFLTVLGGAWTLALSYKIIGDTWDALFSEDYKTWLKKYKQHGKQKITEAINGNKTSTNNEFEI